MERCNLKNFRDRFFPRTGILSKQEAYALSADFKEILKGIVEKGEEPNPSWEYLLEILRESPGLVAENGYFVLCLLNHAREKGVASNKDINSIFESKGMLEFLRESGTNLGVREEVLNLKAACVLEKG